MVGPQFTSLAPRIFADLDTVSCAYQCLRMLNYVSQPTVEVIQILLIISNVLSYNMNAGASYTLLGKDKLQQLSRLSILTLWIRYD